MNIANEIYTLEGKKEKLEFELMEEQYHYDSIPGRRSDTIQKASMCLVVICFSIMTLIIALKEFIRQIKISKEMRAPNIAMGVEALLVPIIVIASAIILIFFIRMYLDYSKHLLGNQKNSENYHSENFKKEALASMDKLENLHSSIEEMDKKISYLKSMARQSTPTIDSIMLLKNIDVLDEEFLRYAYGTWGDSQEVIHMNIDFKK